MARCRLIDERVRRLSKPVWRLVLLAALAGALPAPLRAAEPEQKRVLILHSFGREFRPWSEYARTIRQELDRQSPRPLELQEQTLATARSDAPEAEAAFVEYLRVLYANRPPHLVLTIGAPAANFAQNYRAKLFPQTSFLLTAVEQRRVDYGSLTGNDAVVAVANDFPLFWNSILQVLPDTRTIAVVIGASPIEKFWRRELEKEAKAFENRVRFVWYADLAFEQILKQAASLPPHTAILWQLMSVDAAGVTHEGDAALRRLGAVANAPIFSYQGAFFGRDIVGGPMHSVLEASRQSASVAVRILGGEKAGDIELQPIGFAAPRYDWRQMQRWGISERNLPAGSQIDFRDPSAWEKYRWQVAFVCAVVLLQAGLISVLLYERRRRRLAELDVRQRIAELAHVNRYSMAGELTTSIAHELNQPLGSILVNSETAALMLEAPTFDVKELKEILSDISRDDRRASEVIRRLRSLLKRAPFEAKVLDVNESVLETIDLMTALAQARGVSLESMLAPVPLLVKADNIQLQQVLINVLINAMDAMAHTEKSKRRISMHTARQGDSAEIEISDTGPGIVAGRRNEIFEPFYTTRPNGMGMGLSIARTIIDAHDGQIFAENRAEGRGAVFRIVLPLARAAVSDLAAS